MLVPDPGDRAPRVALPRRPVRSKTPKIAVPKTPKYIKMQGGGFGNADDDDNDTGEII